MPLFGNKNNNVGATGPGDLNPLPEVRVPTQAPAPTPVAVPEPVASAPVASTAPSNLEYERWQEEKVRYERQLLESEFSDALDRLGNIENAFMRAGGASRLTSLALRRSSQTNAATMTTAATASIDAAFPFFVRASSHLAAALHLEEDPSVRDEIRKAIDSLTDLVVMEGDGGQLALYRLLNDVADANRSAKRAFVNALAHYISRNLGPDGQPSLEMLRPLVGITSFCTDEEQTFRCLADLTESQACKTATQVRLALGYAHSLKRSVSATQSNDTLEVIWRVGERLRETVTALTTCLRACSAVPTYALSTEQDLYNWRRAGRRINLAGAFLAGARLGGTQLSGAHLMDAFLHGATLENANLIGADLGGARLSGADLLGITVEVPGGTSHNPKTDLRRADWWNADPASWRGVKGETLKGYLAARFAVPQDEPPVPSLPTVPTAVPVVGVTPLATPPVTAAAKGPGVRTARSLFGGGRPTPGAVDNTVQIRESGLPRDTDRVGASDLGQIQDLMLDRDGPSLELVDTDTVQVRDKAQGSSADRVTNDDVLQIQDLMKDR